MIEYLSTALSSLKVAKDTVKQILDAPKLLEKSEMEIKLASVNKSLFEAENALLESQQLLKDKEKKIKELEDSLKFKGKLIRQDNRYFEVDKDGKPIGDPICSSCWDSQHKKIHLFSLKEAGKVFCPTCKIEVEYPISTFFVGTGGKYIR